MVGSEAPKAQFRRNQTCAKFCPDWPLATGNPTRFARPIIGGAAWDCLNFLQNSPEWLWGAIGKNKKSRICKTLLELAPGTGLAMQRMLLAYEFMAVLAQTMTSPSAPDAITEAISVDTILARFEIMSGALPNGLWKGKKKKWKTEKGKWKSSP